MELRASLRVGTPESGGSKSELPWGAFRGGGEASGGARGCGSGVGSARGLPERGAAAGPLREEAPCQREGWSGTWLIARVIDNKLLGAVGRNFWVFDSGPGLGSGHCCGAESSRLLGRCLSWTKSCFNSCLGQRNRRR